MDARRRRARDRATPGARARGLGRSTLPPRRRADPRIFSREAFSQTVDGADDGSSRKLRHFRSAAPPGRLHERPLPGALETPKAERNLSRRRGLAARARVRVVPGFARVANRGAPVVSLAMAFARDPALSLAMAIASALIAEPSSVGAPRDVRGCLQGALRSRRGGRGRRRGLTPRVDGGARERVVPAEKTVSGRRRTGLRGRLVVRARGGSSREGPQFYRLPFDRSNDPM